MEDENQEAEDTLAGVTVGALRNFLRQVCGISNVSLHDGDRCCSDALVHYVFHSAAAGNQLLLTMSCLQVISAGCSAAGAGVGVPEIPDPGAGGTGPNNLPTDQV